MATEVLIVPQDDMTLDLVMWRRFQAEYPGFVERTLDQNPGLADLGPILPVGTKITVELPSAATKKTARVIRLWGK